MMLSDRSQRALGHAGIADRYAYKAVATGPETGETGAPPLLNNEDLQVHAGSGEGSSCRRDCQGLVNIICSPLNVLLVFVPLGFVSYYRQWSSAAIFTLNFLGIVPLASILGKATESLAVHTGQLIGGLLNATFGNAVEMIVTVQAIKAGLVDVVQGSLLGSILSNLLLVLGMAFFAAGLVTKCASFNATGASTNTTCLVLGSIALALPTVYDSVPNTEKEDTLMISRISSMLLATIYLLFLVFQLITHAEYFTGEEEEEEESDLSCFSSVILLFLTTVCVAYNSDFLIDSIEGVTKDYGVPEAFIGVILLPIVGNAAEHVTSVSVAVKGKMDLALGVAVGSSTQIVLFVVPFSVLTGWFFDVPMSLDFRNFDAAVLLLSVFLASTVLHDGRSNWLEGAMLVATYLLIAVICWYIPKAEEELV